MSDLENMTLLELRNFAKEHNIKNISKLKKEELIVLLNQIKDSSKPKVEENDELRYDENDDEQMGELSEASSTIEYKVTNDDDQIVEGILEVLPDGYGFLRGDNYLSSPKDVYISPIQIRRFKLDTGDIIKGIARTHEVKEKEGLTKVGNNSGLMIALTTSDNGASSQLSPTLTPPTSIAALPVNVSLPPPNKEVTILLNPSILDIFANTFANDSKNPPTPSAYAFDGCLALVQSTEFNLL